LHTGTLHRRVVVEQEVLGRTFTLYHAFAPEKARALIERFEFHYTPKHASWLNLAECELSALSRQCLHRRIPDKAALSREIRSWELQRNQDATKLHWRFTTADARIKLHRLYPSFQP
jgi:hypothetical protein